MTLPRRSGILLHPTSLPGPHGSGDFGPAAYHFIDWLVAAGQRVWQVLPLTPIGPGNSPYASVSAFAGSPLLVALEPLIDKGWIDAAAAATGSSLPAGHVDFERAVPWRMARLREAAVRFERQAGSDDRAAFAAFSAAEAHWLDDYALFMALDGYHRQQAIWSWTEWDPGYARRDPAALAAARTQWREEIDFWRFVQWCFVTQWRALKRYANQRDVQIAGDLPIFVAHHSADCWARPDLFLLNAEGEPRVVAGVPPDYFSATGQRWGNPLYDWPAMQREGFAWWVARLRHELARADVVRIDHFRGFAAYWEIPAACPTAVEGRWVPAPGVALFDALKTALGRLPVIAEDLGVITPDVEALRDRCGFPGMKILQFAFGGDATHAFLPHNYPAHCVAYSGTHDNDTAQGWYEAAPGHERRCAEVYLDTDGADIHWAMIRAICGSVAELAVYPMQDVLGLGTEHRMNTPGRLDCWTWRFGWRQVGAAPAQRLAAMSAAFGRAPIERLQASADPAEQMPLS
jgi:4-alpha-glucanotransferase